MRVDVERAALPANEELRIAAVQRYDILDTPPDGTFDRITALAARLFGVPIAIVSIVDHDRIWFKSHHGLDIEQLDRAPGLCASAILQDGPWVIGDAPNDPRALSNPLVAGAFGLRFYAGAPLRTSDGFNLGTLCILDFEPRTLSEQDTATLEDLSQMVVSELEVRLASRRAFDEARERERLKDAFMGMLSHELRTPVTTIYGAAQLLARNPAMLADPHARELLPDIAAESDRLLRLIENLLVLTRLEQGRLEAALEPVLIQRVLPAVIAQEARRWPERTIRLDATPNLAPAAADQVYVEQVMTNLLSNALKYSPTGAAVDVTARAVDGEIEVRVRDRGIGLQPRDLDAIFELLMRTAEATRYAGGAGVGLYVCRRLVQAMRGTISAEAAADEDHGTIFTFRLPMATA